MRTSVVTAAALLASACGARDLGLDALLRIEGGYYVEGPLPAESGGPAVLSLETTRNALSPGDRGHILRGTLPGQANGLALMRAGDPGHWIVTAGPPDIASPELLSFDLRAELDHGAPTGELRIETRATDRDGRTGATRALALMVEAEPVDDAELSVTLAWEGAADLDLRVVDPAGTEIGVRNPNAWEMPPPEAEPDPTGWREGATLDVDAQAGCTAVGRRRERVRWPIAPAAGTYLVRVDTYSLCGDASARWRVIAARQGVVLGEAQGVSTPVDTRFSHDRGAGVLALRFEVP